MKEEENKEPSCVKIENGIAPNHGLVRFFLSYFILLEFILKSVLCTVEQETMQHSEFSLVL